MQQFNDIIFNFSISNSEFATFPFANIRRMGEFLIQSDQILERPNRGSKFLKCTLKIFFIAWSLVYLKQNPLKTLIGISSVRYKAVDNVGKRSLMIKRRMRQATT